MMTPLRAKRVLTALVEDRITESSIESLSPYLSLTLNGGRIDCQLNADELRAIVTWLDDSDGVVNS